MDGRRLVFQISGIKIQEKKKVLVQGIQQLGGEYRGGSVYQQDCTHLIIPQVLSSEKFLAACAAGKWVLTPDYVLDSVENGSWLSEEPYEVAVATGGASVFHPVRRWRQQVAGGGSRGAFQGWRVLLRVPEPPRRAMFRRLLKAGGAKVYRGSAPPHASVTHIMAKSLTNDSNSHNAPCYPVSHIVQHLFGSHCVDMKFNLTDELPAETKSSGSVDADLSRLEAELRDHVIRQEERPRLCFLQFLRYQDPYRPPTQASAADLSNVGSMMEVGLFSEALDSIRGAVFPGLLPPAPYLISLLEHAQQGNATPAFVGRLQQVLHSLLVTNPPWLAAGAAKKYFRQVLQCPRCQSGLWPFLETAISYFLPSGAACHRLPGPGLPSLVRFHTDLLAFCLELFQGELHSVTTWDFLLSEDAGVSQASGSLLSGTFWTVWERSTLLSRAVKQLTQLLVQAAVQEAEEQKLRLSDTLMELLSVLVEFWCQQHFKLNQNLVENGLKDLAEHFTVISQDVSPVVLAELVVRIHSSRLKLAIADAVFRNVCCRNGFTAGDEPLSLRKLMLSYLPALGSLAESPSGAPPPAGQTSHSCSSNTETSVVTETGREKENVLRGVNRVNAAGETLLHRACKRNQVETVRRLLALPVTDVNAKDHAGWTPLHEACNHGSTACVEALLRHRPVPVLNSQVGGVSPLHDALLNGHMDIASLLLQRAGSVLLQQTGEGGRSVLDLVSAPAQREELLRSAQLGDSALRSRTVSQVLNLPLLEAGSALLAHLVYSYQQERGLWELLQPGCRLVTALAAHSHQAAAVTAGWTEQRAVRLVEDTHTLLQVGGASYLCQVCEAVRRSRGQNTAFLMEVVDSLTARGRRLLDAAAP